MYYNKSKIDKGEALLLGSFNSLLLPGEDFDMHRAEATFAPYLEANVRTRMPTFHVSLNPSPEDRLTDEQLLETARYYMERMGYGSQPYFVFKHTDIARTHVHIVSLRIDAEGRKLPHDFEARRSMTILRELEKQYGLHPSVKGEEQPMAAKLHKVDYRASDVKRQIASVVRTVLRNFDCPSAAELRTLLGLFNVSLEEQVGVIRGREYTGMIYRAMTDEGIHVGVPIKAGSIGRDVGYDALQRFYRKSEEECGQSDRLESLREKVSAALRQASGEVDFIERLADERITAVLPHNDKGRIFAATFIDLRSGTVSDGVRLGRAFAAYALEWRLNGEGRSNRNDTTYQRTDAHPASAVLDALFNLIDARGFEEEQLLLKRKRKRKRKHKI